MATFITKVNATPINLYLLTQEYEKIKYSIFKKINDMYNIKCEKCNNMHPFSSAIWEQRGKTSTLINIRVQKKSYPSDETCQFNGFIEPNYKLNKNQLLQQQVDIPYWFPVSKIHAKLRPAPVTHFYELFTKRNLYGLSLLFQEIEHIQDEKIRNAFQYIFTNMLYGCSRMQMYSKDYPQSTRGWTALRYYLPKKYQERNVWMVFENKYNRFIKMKKILNAEIPTVSFANSIDDFITKEANVLLINQDAETFKIYIPLKFDYVYLDPPYHYDIEYLAFSEFWGCWLKQKFDFNNEIILHKQKSFEHKMEKIVGEICKNVDENGIISLAFSGNKKFHEQIVTKLVEICLHNNFQIYSEKSILLNHPQDRGSGTNPPNLDKYINFKKNYTNVNSNYLEMDPKYNLPKEINEKIISYLRLRLALSNNIITDPYWFDILEKTVNEIVPEFLAPYISKLNPQDIIDKLPHLQHETYMTMCYVLIKNILEDDWELSVTNRNNFLDNAFGIDIKYNSSFKQIPLKNKKWIIQNIDMVAKKDNKILYFVFKENKHNSDLEIISNQILSWDRKINQSEDLYNHIAILIFKSNFDNKSQSIDEELTSFRGANKIKVWKRGFFTSFYKLWETIPYENSLMKKPFKLTNEDTKVNSYKAIVKQNDPVPFDQIASETKHKKLRLKIENLLRIQPGQFILIDCLTDVKKQDKYQIKNKELKLNSILINTKMIGVKKEKIPYLKRPFGIHRTFFTDAGFKTDYLKNLSLPSSLSKALHTAFPDTFEIFYKVIDGGVGTREMESLEEGDTISVVGPLGNHNYFRKLLKVYPNIDFLLIGGGTGMAPLIHFAQALKYYNIPFTAFIGIDSFENLKQSNYHESYNIPNAQHRNCAYLYIDDLKELGLCKENIYLSITSPGKKEYIAKEGDIPITNIHEGFVSKQLEMYLKKQKGVKNLCVISCGPEGMSKSIAKITRERGIPLKVYLEKRMACGIGVCLSCVQKIKGEDGTESYIPICTNGPVFDESDIVWEV